MLIDHRSLVTAGKRLARVAGGLYLLIVALGGLAHLAIRAGVHVPGYAVTTAQDIAAGPILVPAGPAADFTIAAIFALVGVTMYLLMRRIDRRAARPLVIFVAVAAGLILINLAFHHAGLLVAAGSPRSGGLVVLLLEMHDHGHTITGAFLALWLLALGYLAYQSSLFPRVVSTLLIVSLILSALVGVGWPELPTVVHAIIAPPPVADLWLVAYLVTKGIPARRPDQLVAAAVSA